jgi:valyl-tRNA synthetase
MALNAASHNTTGEPTGPVSGAPPPLSDDTKSAILQAAAEQGGQSSGGQEHPKEPEKKQKSEKELAREKAKADKLKKFEEKKKAQASKQATTASAPAAKAKKPKEEKEAPIVYVEETPFGEKKILKSLEDPERKAYIPSVVESAWGAWWEKSGFFKPDFSNLDNGTFVIPIPPPNVTGALHIGHALANSLQDCLIRWNRMQGKTTLFLPGCDHAGISTQSVVENILWRRENKTRHDLGREKLVERIWAWKGDYHKRIVRVLKRLGGSYDWSREAFTMDANLSKAVTETFCKLHEEGLIYRAERLVNWCVQLQTALSNLEVDNKEITGRTLLDVPGYERKVEFGVIITFKYPIEGSDETIAVATTRIETMLGDTGIAVSPKDERYKRFIGKNVRFSTLPSQS